MQCVACDLVKMCGKKTTHFCLTHKDDELNISEEKKCNKQTNKKPVRLFLVIPI